MRENSGNTCKYPAHALREFNRVVVGEIISNHLELALSNLYNFIRHFLIAVQVVINVTLN